MHTQCVVKEHDLSSNTVAAFTLDPCMQLMLQLPQLTNLQFLGLGTRVVSATVDDEPLVASTPVKDLT
jgi:pyrimidine deaminase RibD-like protein